MREHLMGRTAPAPTPAENPSLPVGSSVSADFERECVEFFADVVGVLGVPRSVGQIYGLLFSSPEPLSFTDIAARLDISKGSASQGLQALRQLGAIHLAEVRATHAEMGDGRWKMGRSHNPEIARSREAEMATTQVSPEAKRRADRAGAPWAAMDANRRSEIGSNARPNSQLPTSISAHGVFRRELYVPELGLRKLVSGVLREKVEPIVKDGGARVKALRARAEAAPDAAARKFSTTRVKQIETWRRQMRLLLPLLKTILGPVRT